MKKTIIYILVITLTVALSACGKKGGISESQIKDAPQITDEDQEVKPIRDFSKENEKDVTSEDEPENTEDNSEGNNPEESDPGDMDYNPEEDPEIIDDSSDGDENKEPERRILTDDKGNALVEISIPSRFICTDDSDPAYLSYTDKDGCPLNISYVSELPYEYLLNTGREIELENDIVGYTEGDEDYSKTLLFLGTDTENNNYMIFSAIEYGDVPLTYRELYIGLDEENWVRIYSSDFQQNGIDNMEAIEEQYNLYFELFRNITFG